MSTAIISASDSSVGKFLTRLFQGVDQTKNTAMAKAGGKLMTVYNKRKRAKLYKQAVKKTLNIQNV